jgi:hypothetical protein
MHRRALGKATRSKNMAKAATIVLLGLVLVLGTYTGVLLLARAEPSTEALDADLAEVRAQIKVADEEDSKYEGGVIKALISIRREILRTSEAMLAQKRASFLRRIELKYVIDGKATRPAGDERLKEIAHDLDKANSALSKDLAEASRYSGGVTQAMSLMAVATDNLTVAQLYLAYFGAKYGMALPIPAQQGAAGTAEKPAPGVIVKDKDAL